MKPTTVAFTVAQNNAATLSHDGLKLELKKSYKNTFTLTFFKVSFRSYREHLVKSIFSFKLIDLCIKIIEQRRSVPSLNMQCLQNLA